MEKEEEGEKTPEAKGVTAPDEMDLGAEEVVKVEEEVKVEVADQRMEDVDENVVQGGVLDACPGVPAVNPGGGLPLPNGSAPPLGPGAGAAQAAPPPAFNPGTPKATTVGTSSLNSSMSGGSNAENKVPDVPVL